MTMDAQSYIDAGLALGLDLEALSAAVEARRKGSSQPTYYLDDGPSAYDTNGLPTDAAVTP